MTSLGWRGRRIAGAVLAGLALVWVARSAQAAVTLLYFTASGQAGRISVTWATATEIDHAGFYVRRALAAEGPFARLGGFIAAQGDGLTGWAYTFEDMDVADGTTYYYELESVASNQQITVYGPITAIPGAASTATPTRTPTATFSLTPTGTPTHTPSPSATPSATSPASASATATAISIPPSSPAPAPTTRTVTEVAPTQSRASGTALQPASTPTFAPSSTSAATLTRPDANLTPTGADQASPPTLPTAVVSTDSAGSSPDGEATATDTPAAVAAVSDEADQAARDQIPGGAQLPNVERLGQLWALGFLAVFLGGFGLVGALVALSLIRPPARPKGSGQ